MKRISSFLIVLGFLVSCDKSPNEEPQDKNPILLGSTSVSLLAGATTTISLQSEGEYGLLAFDPDIAYGSWVNPQTIIIFTDEIGETKVRVKDINDHNRYLDVLVQSRAVNGRYIDKLPLSSLAEVKIHILTLMPNKELEQAITEELTKYVNKQKFTTYDFDYENKKVDILLKDETKYQGTYDWSNQKLTVYYNGIEDKYTTQHFTEDAIRIFQDFTEKYQGLYPDAKIQYVEVERYLTIPKVSI